MKTKAYKTKSIIMKMWAELNFSQAKISGFDLEIYQNSNVLLIGAGAIGSYVALAMIRKGIGWLDIYDDDNVELRNLTRQFFSLRDVGKNKAICLSRIVSKQGFFKSTIRGYAYRFQEALEMGIDLSNYDAIICGVDNNPTRVSTAEYCLRNDVPLIVCAVSRDGNQMYCVVQEPNKACFGCIMPQAINDDSYPCNLPGIIDIIQVVSGFTAYAVDTIVMKRHREWNLKMVCLDGSVPDSSLLVPRKTNCVLCG